MKEGKIRYYGSALGPDIGWYEEGEASMRERHVSSLQIIYSILEQEPARRFFPIAEEEQVGYCPACPTLPRSDGAFHRAPCFRCERPQGPSPARVDDPALQKADQVKFLAKRRADPFPGSHKVLPGPASIVSVLPNITNIEELKEYASAPEAPNVERGGAGPARRPVGERFLPGGNRGHLQRRHPDQGDQEPFEKLRLRPLHSPLQLRV